MFESQFYAARPNNADNKAMPSNSHYYQEDYTFTHSKGFFVESCAFPCFAGGTDRSMGMPR